MILLQINVNAQSLFLRSNSLCHLDEVISVLHTLYHRVNHNILPNFSPVSAEKPISMLKTSRRQKSVTQATGYNFGNLKKHIQLLE